MQVTFNFSLQKRFSTSKLFKEMQPNVNIFISIN